jgi:hypothetical protein
MMRGPTRSDPFSSHLERVHRDITGNRRMLELVRSLGVKTTMYPRETELVEASRDL